MTEAEVGLMREKLEAGKGEAINSLLQLPERAQPC